MRRSLGGAKDPGVGLAVVVGAALMLAASGTAVGPSTSQPALEESPPDAVKTAVVRPAAGAARVKITPSDGARRVRPDLGVTVRVADGALIDVSVRSDGRGIPGELSADRKSWKTRWTLTPDRSYTVRATATGRDGRTVTTSSKFTTLQAAQTVAISDVTPGPGETVGVGMPIIVTFNRPVLNKAQVERALVVRSSHPAQGAWHWVGDQQAIFRTKSYWAAHQQVSLTAHLAGVRAARDVYGVQDSTTKFRIGDANVSKVDVAHHRMVVRRNGKKVRTVPISAGRGGQWRFTTTSGVHAVMRKASPVVMTSAWMGITDPEDPEYYKLTVYSAVQISSSGEYVHSAPWSVWAQGSRNVSHGCVNASPEFAAWFYRISQRGDIVTVTGSGRPLAWNNGYGYWQLPWKQWLKGSARKHAVSTAGAPTAPARATGDLDAPR